MTGGNYSVTIDMAGFKRTVVQSVRPGVDVDVTLEVGAVAETVTVTSRQVNELPLNGRDSKDLLQLQPGAVSGTTISDALLNGDSGVQAAAAGEEVGDLFEYKIEQPVTVNRDRSALIPIIQTKMDDERVAI